MAADAQDLYELAGYGFAVPGMTIWGDSPALLSPTRTHTTDTYLRPTRNFRTHTTDTLRAKRLTKTHTTDTYLFPSTSYLTDNFNDNSIDAAKWATSSFGTATATESGNKFNLTISASSSAAYLDSVNAYTLTSSSVFLELVQTSGSSGDYGFYFQMFTPVTFVQQITWEVAAGTIKAWSVATGYLATATYVPATHRWLRIRESAGTMYWDYSADGFAWINFTSTTTPANLNGLKFEISSYRNTSTGTLSTIIDNFNVLPTRATPNHTTDTLKRRAVPKTYTTDTLKRKVNTKTHTTDTYKRLLVNLKSHTTDTLKRTLVLKAYTTDTLKHKLFLRTYTTDTYLKKVVTHTYTTNTLKRARRASTWLTDTYKRGLYVVLHTTDTYLRRIPYDQVTSQDEGSFIMHDPVESENMNPVSPDEGSYILKDPVAVDDYDQVTPDIPTSWPS